MQSDTDSVIVKLATCLVAITFMSCGRLERSGDTLGGSVLIVIDTLRADHVGAYGSQLALTPNLDSLAAGGLLFEQAVAPSAWTRPTVASIFGSRYPAALGVGGREDSLPDEVVTLAETLGASGVQTLAVSTNRNAGAELGFAQGFDRFEVPELTASYPDDFHIHTAEGVTRRALRMLDERAEDRPFFLFLHYVDPHDPYLPHPGLSPEPEPPGRFDGSRRDLRRMDAMPAQRISETDRARIRHLYAGEVRYCDHWLGELLSGLEARGLAERILLIVTADHGEGLWDHDQRAHGQSLFEDQVHVPLIVVAPRRSGGVPRRIATPVSLVDLAPTILAAHRVAAPEGFRGRDLLSRNHRGRNEPIYSELSLDGNEFDAVRQGSLKLIRDRRPASGGSLALYDLASDPGELRDLAALRPEEVARLERVLDHLADEARATSVAKHRVGVDELDRQTVRDLAALGYLGGGARGHEEGRSTAKDLLSRLDFARAELGTEQLISGFYEHERDRRWMADHAEVILARPPDATRWRIEGWIDLDLHQRDSLVLTVLAGDAEPERRTIERSGFFTLRGSLPASERRSLRLRLSCDHTFQPVESGLGDDRRRLSVVLRSIGLD